MHEVELELTFLAKSLPPGLKQCKFVDLLDIYLPAQARHPVLRLRKKGEKYEITKKQPVAGSDSSEMDEHTVPLTKEEFDSLATIEGKRVHKNRYYYNWHGHAAEVDVFLDKLQGLVLVDFEFKTKQEKDAFKSRLPEFCLTEITQQEFIAGGMLCGKGYEDIEAQLNKFGYRKIV